MKVRIYTEDDLRKIVLLWFKNRVSWVEPGIGGTVGLPDALIAFGEFVIPVELKCSVIKLFRDDTFRWKTNLRPGQFITGKRFLDVGVNVRYLVIDPETKAVYGCYYSDFHDDRDVMPRMTWLEGQEKAEVFLSKTPVVARGRRFLQAR